jgi:hypothetical protein
MIGARSEFAAFIAALLTVPLTWKTKASYLYLTVVVGIYFFVSHLTDVSAVLELSRVGEVVRISESTSFQARAELSADALDTIKRSPLMGDYASYAIATSAGAYAHNVLSVWVDLGIIGFVLYLFLLIVPLTHSFFLIFKTSLNNNLVRFCFITSLITMLLLLTAKDFRYMLFAVTLGSYSQLIWQLRQSRRNSLRAYPHTKNAHNYQL